jgi:hypothetical protein
MTTHRQNTNIALHIWVLAIGLSTLTGAAAQTDNKEAPARLIARERFQFVNRISAKLDVFPIYRTAEEDYATLFPVGRSDRMYLLFKHVYWPNGEGPNDVIFCYQRKNGKDKLVYRVKLEPIERVETKARPAKIPLRTKSLLEYITTEDPWVRDKIKLASSYAVMGTISQFAKNDLAAEQDYAVYYYTPCTSLLRVWLLSDLKNGRQPDLEEWGPEQGFYNLGEDPYTKAKLKEGVTDKDGVLSITPGKQEFYQKYGLPLAATELSH